MYQPELPGLDGRPTARAGDRSLRLRGPDSRYAALLAEHQRLLDRVAIQRQRLRRMGEEIRSQESRMASVVEPLRERLLELDREVHALFGELLAPKRLSRQARREVSELYRFLQKQQVLSPAPGRPLDGGEPPPSVPPRSRPEEPVERRPPAQGLRELFLGLARALHPDRAQGASDLAARTEAMKEVNQAYRAGDLGRLLELQRSWSVAQAAPVSPDEAERRCQDLERTNRELREQLTRLDREEKDLRRSELGRLFQLGKRSQRRADPLASLEAEGREHIESLGKLRDLVRRFRDGEISLARLLAGPGAGEDLEADLDFDALAALAQLAAELEGQRHRAGAGGRRGRRRRR